MNLHFWIIYNTHCWFNMLLCTCTMSHLCLEVTFLDHFCEHELVDHFFFGTYIFGSHFFHTNGWIISFLELSETKMIQKCKFQKRNDPPICVISFLELTFLGHFFYTNWWINMVLCICTMCYYYYPLDHHMSAWMVREIVDHFARQWGGGFMG